MKFNHRDPVEQIYISYPQHEYSISSNKKVLHRRKTVNGDLHGNGLSNGFHLYEKGTPPHQDLSNDTSTISLRRLVEAGQSVTY